MVENKDIEILSGDARINNLSDCSYKWPGQPGEYCKLIFEEAYEIEPIRLGAGLSDLTFRVHGREFKDLSFLKGKILQEYLGDYDIRRHPDGTIFLFSYEEIPTFDSGDREWDSMRHIAVYADESGINMLHCTHGYLLPRIQVYIGLWKSSPTFTEWLKLLGCADLIENEDKMLQNLEEDCFVCPI